MLGHDVEPLYLTGLRRLLLGRQGLQGDDAQTDAVGTCQQPSGVARQLRLRLFSDLVVPTAISEVEFGLLVGGQTDNLRILGRSDHHLELNHLESVQQAAATGKPGGGDNWAMDAPRELVILGSTGSIGTQAIDLVLRNPGAFRIRGLAAAGSRPGLLGRQAAATGATIVAVADVAAVPLVLAAWRESAEPGAPAPRILVGPDAAAELAGEPVHTVLNGMNGSIGLGPTLAALAAGNTLALANKESLIVGGPLVLAAAAEGQIVPVDSEHSALAQCLRAGGANEVRRLVLTASGGPFRGWESAVLKSVTPAEALAHPTWSMGPVVTINSATLMNKGLEVIEAHLLFGIEFERIDVVVHPQSVVHSMVEFFDGSTIAQASPPDMRLPIALALGWPNRVAEAARGCDWSSATSWTFEPLDEAAFPAVALARRAGRTGGSVPAVLNAANEQAVAAFLAGSLDFPGIIETVKTVVDEHGVQPGNEVTLAGVLQAEGWARNRADELIGAGN